MRWRAGCFSPASFTSSYNNTESCFGLFLFHGFGISLRFFGLGCGSGVPYPFPESIIELGWESECDSAPFTSEDIMSKQDYRFPSFPLLQIFCYFLLVCLHFYIFFTCQNILHLAVVTDPQCRGMIRSCPGEQVMPWCQMDLWANTGKWRKLEQS